MEQPIIRAVTHDVSESKVTVAGVPDKPGVSATLFRALADAGVNVDMIVQNVAEDGRTDISFTVPTESVSSAVAILEAGPVIDLGGRLVTTDDAIGKVSVIGAGMKSNPGVAATMFETLAGKRDQHRDDLDLGHPHQLRRGLGRGRAGRAGPPHRLRPRRRLIPSRPMPVP